MIDTLFGLVPEPEDKFITYIDQKLEIVERKDNYIFAKGSDNKIIGFPSNSMLIEENKIAFDEQILKEKEKYIKNRKPEVME